MPRSVGRKRLADLAKTWQKLGPLLSLLTKMVQAITSMCHFRPLQLSDTGIAFWFIAHICFTS